MSKLVVANWKMNPSDVGQAKRLVRAYPKNRSVDIVVCPPAIFLQQLYDTRKDLFWGAQDCFWEDSGAYTGELSPKAVKSTGAQYVIIGHSERRQFGRETDKEVGKKIDTAISAGLRPIVCVGGGLEAKKAGAQKISEIVTKQLLAIKKNISKKNSNQKLVFAYEPVWAIGTGKNANVAHVAEIFYEIQRVLKSYQLPAARYKLLYGGSVNAKNAVKYISVSGFAGFLVGGASLKHKEFNKIVSISS